MVGQRCQVGRLTWDVIGCRLTGGVVGRRCQVGWLTEGWLAGGVKLAG